MYLNFIIDKEINFTETFYYLINVISYCFLKLVFISNCNMTTLLPVCVNVIETKLVENKIDTRS